MPEYSFDFPDDREFELIDVNKYNCIVDQIEERKSAGGYPYLNWRFKIVDGKFKGRILFYMTSLQEQAMWKIKDICKALGVPVQPGVNRVNTDNLVGKPCICTVGHREYNDTMQEEITAIEPGTVTGGAVDMVPNVGVQTPTQNAEQKFDEMVPGTTPPSPSVQTAKPVTPTTAKKSDTPF